MLSAIAARKAAQSTTTTTKPATSPVSTPSSPSPPPQRPSPIKRKSNTESPRKKAKRAKQTTKKRPQARYFEQQQDQDVVIVDSEDEKDASDAELGVVAAVYSAANKSRGWSPSRPVRDMQDESMQLPEETSPLSTFVAIPNQNIFFLETNPPSCLVLFDPSHTLCLLGTYHLTVVHGLVSLSGVTLSASKTSHRVYSSRSSPLPIIRHVSSGENAAPDPFSFLDSRFRSLLKEEVAAFVIQQLDNGINGLGNVFKTFEDFFEPSDGVRMPFGGVPGVYQITNKSGQIQEFYLPDSWSNALSQIDKKNTGVYLVKGAKKSGKSTFARTLTNRLLSSYQRVAFLECDLGQSEFTPGGMVALNVIEQPLFGPPFTHPSIPVTAHYVGSTSPKSSPSHYLASIEALLQTYILDVQTPLLSDYAHDDNDRIMDSIPLVVNTMGWTKGLGADLTKKIEDMCEPTFVFEIEAPLATYNAIPQIAPFPIATTPLTVNHRVLEPIPSTMHSPMYTPADQRTLSLLSYFYAIFPHPSSTPFSQNTATYWDCSVLLCDRPPYEVNGSIAFDRVFLAGAGMEDVVHGEIRRVLNGAIVALVSTQPGSLPPLSTPSENSIAYTQGAVPPSPTTSTCLGLAFIRGVSQSSTQVHLLTPLSPESCGEARVVVKGEMEMPIWGWMDASGQRSDGNAPYLQWGKGEGAGAERRRVRRNLMRKGQM